MCIRDRGVGAYNGDIGIVESINMRDRSMVVRLDDRRLLYPAENLNELEIAYAITAVSYTHLGSMSRCKPLAGVVKTFVWIIRGTPLMLQIIVIYLGPVSYTHLRRYAGFSGCKRHCARQL